MGWIATSTVDALVANPTIRDIGVVVLWAIVLVGGVVVLVVMYQRWIPASNQVESVGDSQTEVAIESSGDEEASVDLVGRIRDISGLVGKYPNLGSITPPTVVDELGNYITEFYRERWMARPQGDPAEGSYYDNDTILIYEEEFANAVVAVRDYLATRGVSVNIVVDSVRDIRALALRLNEASDWKQWTS